MLKNEATNNKIAYSNVTAELFYLFHVYSTIAIDIN